MKGHGEDQHQEQHQQIFKELFESLSVLIFPMAPYGPPC